MKEGAKGMTGRAMLLIAPFLGHLVIRGIALTMRFSYVDFGWYRDRIEGGGRIILAFWHGRLLMMPYSYPGRGITILVSTHRDGELVARTVRHFGIESVRGSTTRGAFAGLKALLKSARAGRDIAITPDGPKGPRMKAHAGVVQMARATGFPIVPMTFNASKKKPSGAGTPSSCLIHSPVGSSYAASRST
jgi:lysophospholipid acyltransferase (LPLAT)-like uncharacterized protein